MLRTLCNKWICDLINDVWNVTEVDVQPGGVLHYRLLEHRTPASQKF